MNKVKLNQNKDTLEIIRTMASSEASKSWEAQEAIAAVIGPIIEQVLPIYDSSSLIYTDWTFNPNDTKTIPLDMFLGSGPGTVRVWSQQTAGGLPTNVVVPLGDYTYTTHILNSAVAAKKKVIKNAQVNVVEKMVERMIEEIVFQRQSNGWAVVMQAAGTSVNGEGVSNVIQSTTADIFQADDFNRLKVLVDRLRTSWTGGTTMSTRGAVGLTDLFLSPEMMGQIRSWAYQPMNTRGVPDSNESTALGLPDSVRTQIWNAAGIPSIFGVNLHQLLEFGVNRPYNFVFDNAYTAQGGAPSFDPTTQEVILGVNMGVTSFIRPIALDETLDIDTTSTIVVRPDDQFTAREEMIGFYTKVEEGYVGLDNKSVTAIIV